MKHYYLKLLFTALMLLFVTVVVNAQTTQTFNSWVSTNKSDGSTSQTSYTFNVVSGDELTFDWLVSSESNYDWLIVTLNGSEILKKSGEASGSYNYTFTTAGTMTLLVKYTKDGSQSKGSDKGEIYNIKLSASSSAAEPIVGTCGDNLNWELKSGTLAISGTGDMCVMEDYRDYPWYEHEESIQKIVIENGVTSIAKKAFEYYSALTSASIANTVTFIGSYAFHGCSNLSTIDIPDSLEEIEYAAFYQTAWYTNLPKNEEIYLGKVFFLYENEYSYSAPKTITIKEGTLSIAPAALVRNNLKEIIIPGSVRVIGKEAFTQCPYLKKVMFAEGLQRIDYRAFYECRNLEDITLPASLTTIGDYAFDGCDNLESVEIPANVTSVGHCAFSGSYLHTIKVVAENTVYDSRNNCNAIIETATNTLVVGCGTTVIPQDVTAIGDYAFYGCTGITEVVIPSSVTRIGDYAFYGCDELRSIEIPASVTSIGSWAFLGYYNLEEVHISDLAAWCNIEFADEEANPLYRANNLYVNGENVSKLIIPEGVTEIKDYAFYGCTGITEVVIPSSVTRIGNNAFYGCENLANVEIQGAVESLGYNAFAGTAWLDNQPDGVVYVGDVLYCYKGTMPAGTGIVVKDGTLGIANSAFSDCTGLTSIEIPASVTSIGDYAFYNCSSLTSIEIPNSVTSIGESAFWGCQGLASIVFGNGVTSIGSSAFWGCRALKSLIIPEGVTEIKAYTFSGCYNITQIVIPSSVTVIADGAFEYCYISTVYNFSQLQIVKGSDDFGGVASNATTVRNYTSLYGNTYALYGDYIFATSGANHTIVAYLGSNLDIELPQSYNGEVYGIGTVFSGTKITSIVIPDSVTSIGEYAFRNCTNLRSVVIGDGVTSIGEMAFYNCSGLTSIVIPNSVTSIGYYAFGDCTGLTSIEIPNSVTSIGNSVFSCCYSLTNVTIGDSVTSIGDSAFEDTAWYNNQPDGVVYIGKVLYKYKGIMLENTSVLVKEGISRIERRAFEWCSGLISIVIPNSVTSIGEMAFSSCTSLANVEIPNSVTSIGDNAFIGCRALTSIAIPDGITSIGVGVFGAAGLTSVEIPTSVKSIGSWAFNGCPFTSVVIPDSVTSIGEDAFAYCYNLTSVVIPSSVTSIGREAFYDCTALTSITSLIPADALFAIDPYMYVFNNVDKSACTLYVPYGAKETYAATDGWREFQNIVEIDPAGIDEVFDEVKGESGKVKAIYDLSGRVVENPTSGIYIVDGKKVIIK